MTEENKIPHVWECGGDVDDILDPFKDQLDTFANKQVYYYIQDLIEQHKNIPPLLDTEEVKKSGRIVLNLSLSDDIFMDIDVFDGIRRILKDYSEDTKEATRQALRKFIEEI